MVDKIVCVEMLVSSYPHAMYVRHDFWKSTARLSNPERYQHLNLEIGNHILVLQSDLDYSNIPVFRESPVDPYRAYRELERWLVYGLR